MLYKHSVLGALRGSGGNFVSNIILLLDNYNIMIAKSAQTLKLVANQSRSP